MHPSQTPFGSQMPDWFGSGYEPANPYSEQSVHEEQNNPFLSQNFSPQRFQQFEQFQHDHMRQYQAQVEADLYGTPSIPDFFSANNSAGHVVVDEEVRRGRQGDTMAMAMTMDEEEEQEADDNDQDSIQEPAAVRKPKGKSTRTDQKFKEQKAGHKDKFWKQLGTLRGFYNKLIGDRNGRLRDAPLRKVMADAMEERGIGEDVDFVWERVEEFIKSAHDTDVIAAREPKSTRKRRTGKEGK